MGVSLGSSSVWRRSTPRAGGSASGEKGPPPDARRSAEYRAASDDHVAKRGSNRWAATASSEAGSPLAPIARISALARFASASSSSSPRRRW